MGHTREGKMLRRSFATLRTRILVRPAVRMYHPNVVDHYENPRNVGSLDAKDENVGTGLVGAPACGDVMKLQIRVNEDTGVVEEAVFKTFGCGSAIACSSLATEWVKGKDVSLARRYLASTSPNTLSAVERVLNNQEH